MKYENQQQQSNLHKYFFNDNTEIRRYELSNMILKLFEEGDKLIIPEIAKKINMAQETVANIVRGLCTRELIEGLKTQRHTIYFKRAECPLAQMLYPKSIIENFTIKGTVKYACDKGKNISYPMSINHQYRTGNIVYEGGE